MRNVIIRFKAELKSHLILMMISAQVEEPWVIGNNSPIQELIYPDKSDNSRQNKYQ